MLIILCQEIICIRFFFNKIECLQLHYQYSYAGMIREYV